MDSFTTEDAQISVEVCNFHGKKTEDITIKIDCAGSIHGDEDLIDLIVEMLERARANLIARRKATRSRRGRPTKASGSRGAMT